MLIFILLFLFYIIFVIKKGNCIEINKKLFVIKLLLIIINTNSFVNTIMILQIKHNFVNFDSIERELKGNLIIL